MSLSFAVYLEIICFAIALLCLLKVKDNIWRGMIIYLFITCVAEVAGFILKKSHHHNQWIYNISLIGEIFFNSILFGSILKPYLKARPLIIGGLAIIFAVYIFDLVDHGFFVFNDLTVTVMSVIFVVYGFSYFYFLIKEEFYKDLFRDAAFWWVTGSLFYYFGSTAANLFRGFLSKIQFSGLHVSYIIPLVLSVLLYGCWIYSFICKRWLQPGSQT